MRRSFIAALAAVPLLVACAREEAPATAPREGAVAVTPAAPITTPTPAAATPPAMPSPWRLAAGGEGTALSVEDASGRALLRLWCTPGDARLRANAPAFVPIASEERMSLGQGGEVIAMVAGATGDATRGGVTAETRVPPNLRTLLSGRVTATYGAQVSGPHPAPAPALVSDFVAACETGGTARASTADAALPRGSACLVQDGRPVPANRLRAMGTEPFWGVQVDGRCVTYSHPGDPRGTRVWTRFSGSADAGTWTGALDGRPFVMRTRARPGCSDGMSDTRYPIAVSLTVGGAERNGCAGPR